MVLVRLRLGGSATAKVQVRSDLGRLVAILALVLPAERVLPVALRAESETLEKVAPKELVVVLLHLAPLGRAVVCDSKLRCRLLEIRSRRPARVSRLLGRSVIATAPVEVGLLVRFRSVVLCRMR